MEFEIFLRDSLQKYARLRHRLQACFVEVQSFEVILTPKKQKAPVNLPATIDKSRPEAG
jgi:hypothetical protein